MVTLKLTEKKDALSMSLSGGQKRKLSLGCALITGAKGKTIYKGIMALIR